MCVVVVICSKLHGHYLGRRRLTVDRFSYRGGDERFRVDLAKVPPSAYKLSVADVPRSTKLADLEDWAHSKGVKKFSFIDVFERRGEREGLICFTDKADYEDALRDLHETVLNGRRVRVFDEREFSRHKYEHSHRRRNQYTTMQDRDR